MTSILQGQPSKQSLFQAKQESVGFQCIPFFVKLCGVEAAPLFLTTPISNS